MGWGVGWAKEDVGPGLCCLVLDLDLNKSKGPFGIILEQGPIL